MAQWLVAYMCCLYVCMWYMYCVSSEYALRVLPAETRLTVYRRRRVGWELYWSVILEGNAIALDCEDIGLRRYWIVIVLECDFGRSAMALDCDDIG